MGRPSKFTQERAAAICEALLNGATRKAAAEAQGISYDCFDDWLKRGQAESSGRFYRFLQDVTRAEAACEARMAKTLITAAADDWRAAESWLKRRRRDEWSEKLEQAHSGEVRVKVEYADDYSQAPETARGTAKGIGAGEALERPRLRLRGPPLGEIEAGHRPADRAGAVREAGGLVRADLQDPRPRLGRGAHHPASGD